MTDIKNVKEKIRRMEFLKSLFEMAENGMLTWEQFTEAVTKQGLKIGNLTDGAYVSKQKYEDELSARDTRIKALNDTITASDTDLTNLKNTLDGADLESLKKASKDLESLQKKYDKDTKQYQEQLSKQAYEFAVKEFANGQKFTSKAAKRDFINSLMAKNLSMENGQIMGATDFVTAYAQENEDAFKTEEKAPEPQEQKPMFVAPASNGNQTPEDPTGGFASAFHFTEIHPRRD